MVALPELKYTPVGEIEGIHKRLRNTFHDHTTKPIEWRLVQLRKLYWA